MKPYRLGVFVYLRYLARMANVMDEIGSILREARELKGYTVAEVHDKLRISKKYLMALEEGAFEQLPSQTHVRGYLGKYARFLSLESEPLLARYEAIKHRKPMPRPNGPNLRPNVVAPIAPPLPEPETGTFFAAANVPFGEESEPKRDWTNWLIMAAFVVFIGLIGWRFWTTTQPITADESEANWLAAVLNVLESEGETTPALAEELPAVQLNLTPDLTSAELITPTGRTTGGAGLFGEELDASEAVAPTPTRSPLPATLERIDIQLDVTERSWLSVVVDGATVYEGQAQKDDVFNWEATGSVRLRTGNAAGVYVTINGIDLGRLGGRGEVWEEVWETTQ